MRLDLALMQRGLCSSRQRAKAAIEGGWVTVNGIVERKPSRTVDEKDSIVVCENDSLRYVSRGALKLLHGLDYFKIDVTGLRCLDIGASTGGFTQVLLERGVRQVVAVDVGTAQLAQVLREDARVLSLEQTDIRTLDISPVQFCCVDVSFISLRLVLPHVFANLENNRNAICLLKPQFEVGPQFVGKRGVVKDEKARVRALEEMKIAAEQLGFVVPGATPSPITGGNGNVEFLLYLKKEVRP